MLSLQDFAQQWATSSIQLPDNNFTEPSKQEYRLRPSRLGRAAYVTAIEYLVHLHGNPHLAVDNSEQYGRRQDIFRTGHEVEARIVEIMRAAGMVFDYQVPTEFEMSTFVIEGTADLVIDNTVVDIKTASASNFKRLLGGYNDLTYRTQLALYAHGLGVDNVALLLYNKDTSELKYKPITLTDELTRVREILKHLHVLTSLPLNEGYNYVLDTFEVTDPPAQRAKTVPTGKYLVPPDVRYADVVLNVLWQTQEIDGTVYVTGAIDDPCEVIKNSYI